MIYLEDIAFVKESITDNSERLSMISEEERSVMSRDGLPSVIRTQLSCPPLFFNELQNKTEKMRKIQSLDGPKWRYDTTSY